MCLSTHLLCPLVQRLKINFLQIFKNVLKHKILISETNSNPSNSKKEKEYIKAKKREGRKEKRKGRMGRRGKEKETGKKEGRDK